MSADKSAKSIVKSTIPVFLLSFLIKGLGFIKQAVLASLYGATEETDALYVSTSLINALCTVIFSTISVLLLSMYTQKLVVNGRKEANHLIDSALKCFMPISAVLSILCFVGAPILAYAVVPSYTGSRLESVVNNLRILSILFVFWCYFLILNVVAEADKHFLQGKGYSFFQNLFVIAAALILSQHYGVGILVYAYVLAGLVQCFYISFSVRGSYKFSAYGRANQHDIVNLLNMAGPLLIGNAIYEINDIVDKRIASGLDSGTVSILSYGASINEIVTTVIITSVSTVLFSHFATWVAESKFERIAESLNTSINYLMVITLPITIMCIICGDVVVEMLYARGNFGPDEVLSTYGVVAGYAIGFMFQAARANLSKVYYAFGDTKQPMINGVISVVINIILSVILGNLLGAAGIALATSISVFVATLLLFVGAKRYIPNLSFANSTKQYLRIFFAAIFSAFTTYVTRTMLDLPLWMNFIIEGIVCVTSFLGMALILKVTSVYDILDSVQNSTKRLIRKCLKNIRFRFRDFFINRPKRARLSQQEFVIISSDCTGGCIYKDLKCRMNSPTINFYFSASDFVKFCSNIEYYLTAPINEVPSDQEWPCALLGDLKCQLVHYSTVDEFKVKWKERVKRASGGYKNWLYVMTERNCCSKDDMNAFDALPYPNKVLFVHEKRPEIKCSFKLEGSETDDFIKPTMSYSGLIRRYYDQFDWVSFINDARELPGSKQMKKH